MNTVVQFKPKNGVEARCPVQKGHRIPYGPSFRLWPRGRVHRLWRTVVAVGDSVRFGDRWFVPVRYTNDQCGIVCYRFGDLSQGRYDEVSDVRPDTLEARTFLRHSYSLPQIVPATDPSVLDVNTYQPVEEEPSDEAELTTVPKLVYLVHIFGVLGARLGRNDYAERIPVRIPKEFERHWA